MRGRSQQPWWVAPPSAARRAILAGAAAMLTACTPLVVDLTNRPCDAGECHPGYVCHPMTDVCVLQLDIGCDAGQLCPDTIVSGGQCDSPGAFVPCSSAVDDCSQGCRTCSADGTWGDCRSMETCDPALTPTRPCYPFGTGNGDVHAGVGICVRGVETCAEVSGIVGWSACVGAVSPQPDEVCGNETDDDCDHALNEGCDCAPPDSRGCYDGLPPETEGKGLCHGGTQECVDYHWGPCTDQVVPVTEQCNGLDDDCDDLPDDAPALPAVRPCADTGVCALAPLECLGLAGWACAPADYEELEVTCDGLDNDCDGDADEAGLIPEDACPAEGVCATGTSECAGEQGWVCTHADFEAVEVSCDGLDNDCDGDVDEGMFGSSCPDCNDGFDNDDDGAMDYPADPGCSGLTDNDESEVLPDEDCTAEVEYDFPPWGIDTWSTVGEGDEYEGSCAETPDAPEVVYEIVLPAGADGLVVRTDYAATDFNSVIYVRDDCNAVTEIACDDNGAISGTGNSDGVFVRTGALGAGRYFVFVDGSSRASSLVDEGPYRVGIEAVFGLGAPCNPARFDRVCEVDLDCLPSPSGQTTCQEHACDIAQNIGPGTTAIVSTTVGRTEEHEGSCAYNRAPDAVYRLILPSPVSQVHATLDFAETTYDTVLFMRAGCHGAELDCNDDITALVNTNSEITVNNLAAGQYYIFVTGWAQDVSGIYTASGPFKLEVTTTP